jgi:hypothetical protein
MFELAKLGTALLLGVNASFAGAQNNDDVTPVLVAAAQAVRADMPVRGAVTLEPRVVGPGQYVHDAAHGRPNHAPATLSAIKRVLGGSVATIEDAVFCEQDRSKSCFRQGVALVALGAPVFTGDTATVVVYTVEPTGSPRQRVAEAELRVVVVRDKNSWRVLRKEIWRIN